MPASRALLLEKSSPPVGIIPLPHAGKESQMRDTRPGQPACPEGMFFGPDRYSRHKAQGPAVVMEPSGLGHKLGHPVYSYREVSPSPTSPPAYRG